MQDEPIDTPRRIAFWGGILGVVFGLLLLQFLLAEYPHWGQTTIYALATIPPFGLWALTLTIAQRVVDRRAARRNRE
ncbi:hypothetical protein D3874_08170 [Oleomonas cavernae]|uniref:Uncharacterized protein n=1 Tax=Oleomonas cavernae TaxID=2320859 RepID=A0A418WAG7_9PROT|nr:hypothetical protein [Oleomonas cavernae]RJF86995.1 hypothetical protein D3874_08170 [Oleomonas cavernae]